MLSDKYDEFFDELMADVLREEREGKINEKINRKLISWKEREGSESYTYAEIDDMLSIACDISRETEDGHVLFPVKSEDCKIVPRNYYDRYLQEAIDNPERDGKQVIIFRKIPIEKALAILDDLIDGNELGLDPVKLLECKQKISQK